ncbi:MAG: DUF2946 family protein [Alphaproteobacteria bacterium]|nr:DUF2946 family protein [Alphaproteobacteria bacterium]
MQIPKFHRRAIPLVAAFALLLQALLPFAAVYQPVPDATTAERAALFGDKLLICSAEGFRWVRTQDLAEGKAHPQTSSDYKCPLCYIAANGLAVTPPVAAGVVSLSPATLAYVPLQAESSHDGWGFWQKLRTRSPPDSFTA